VGQFQRKMEHSLPAVPVLATQKKSHGKFFTTPVAATGGASQAAASQLVAAGHVEIARGAFGILVTADLEGTIFLRYTFPLPLHPGFPIHTSCFLTLLPSPPRVAFREDCVLAW